MGTQFTVLTGFCIALSFCICSSLEVKGGLGKAERENCFKEKHEPQSRVHHHGTGSGVEKSTIPIYSTSKGN
jgi:hypothetical protein